MELQSKQQKGFCMETQSLEARKQEICGYKRTHLKCNYLTLNVMSLIEVPLGSLYVLLSKFLCLPV